MWPVPDKYETICFSNDTDSIISENIFEAINKDEAESRAYLNCVIENKKNANVHLSVKKIML